jgi:NNP family nitrate/nitrite transporter-like MFS transporter
VIFAQQGVHGVNADRRRQPLVAVIILLMVLMAIFNEAGCGANFALVPHCNPCERISATPLISAG